MTGDRLRSKEESVYYALRSPPMNIHDVNAIPITKYVEIMRV